MKRLLTLWACLLMTGLAMADKVSEMEALKKAQAFMPGERFELKKYSSSAGGQSADVPFYIFNVENGGGYVLVSAEDQTTAILGYSTNGNIDLSDIPDNLRYWLDFYTEEIMAVKEGRLKATLEGTQPTRTNIEPLIKTTWNQDEPYNLMCPDANGVDWNASGYNPNNRCVTGCVATAVAQVMYYHQWPQQTTEIASYTSTAINATLEALPATTLDWTKMKLSYNKTETGDAADAVAKLMRYVGQAFSMNYNISSKGGSGTNIYEDAMINCFNYSKKIHTKNRDYYTTKQWEDMVYDELSHGRPVPYGGFSSSGGHQFVCDGYKDGLFSLNWGWGGKLNGYFVLSLADPNGQQGIGGSNGGYKNRQDAVFYFMPAAEYEEEIPILKSADGINNTQTSNYTRSDVSENFSSVKIPCNYESWYSYVPTTTYDAEVGWGLYKEEQLLQCISSASQTIDMHNIHFPKVQYLTYTGNVMANPFGSNLSDGKYQLRQIWRKAGSNDPWMLMDNYGTNYLVAVISGTSLTIRSKDTSYSAYRVNSISVPNEAIEGEPVTVTVNITNDGETLQETVCLWLQEVGTSDWTKVVSATGNIGPEETGDVILTFTPQAGGSFIMKVTNNESDEALATKDNITIYDVFQVTVGDINYLCITGKNVATVIAGENKQLESVEIPATITIDGIGYKITAIDNNAFYNFSGLKKIILPEGLERIGASAFEASGLKRLELPSTLSSIGQSVIDGCRSLITVVSHIQEPFFINDNTFTTRYYNSSTQQYDYAPSSAKLYVPIGSMSKYQMITGWTMFNGIEEGEEKEATINGLNYSCATRSKKATVIDGDYQSLTSIEIPSTIMVDNVEYTVTAIGLEAFYQCSNLESISLPDGLESIGDRAFYRNNRLGDFKFPSKLKSIGHQAFYSCSELKKAVLPEGFETLGSSVFVSCGLKRLELPSTLSSIGHSVTDGCRSLITVVSHIQEPFLIDDNTFTTSGYNYTTQQYGIMPSPAKLYVPIGTMSKYQMIIGWTMFNAIEEGDEKEATVNGLNYLYYTVSKTATLIASETGDYQALKSVEIPATITADNVEYTVNAIGPEAFYQCYYLESISLPDGLESIGDRAFYRNYRLSISNFPNKLKSIGKQTFTNCSGLKKVILPEGLETIGESAFEACGLKRLELPSTLSSIGSYAFGSCSEMTAVVSHILVPFLIDDNTFTTRIFNNDTRQYDYSPSPAMLFVPIGTTAAYQAITGWTMFMAIEEGEQMEATVDGLIYSYVAGSKKATVTGVEDEQLTSAEILTSITIDNVEYAVKAIDDKAFYQCSKLKSISLPDGLETIGNSAFYSCSNLGDFSMPSSLKSIGSQGFWYCGSLTNIILPEGFESIGEQAFTYCLNLKIVELPSTLKSIGNSAFTKNSSLKKVISHIQNPFNISDDTFMYHDNPSPAILYVPIGTMSKYQEITGWTMFQAIEEGVILETTVDGLNYSYHTGLKKATVIAGDYKQLTSVDIPATITIDGVEYIVKAIEEEAFRQCDNLTSISLPDGLENIGKSAFQSCKNMTDFSMPNSLKSIGDQAFYQCFRLTNVSLPEGLETIGKSAFSYCYGLKKLELPSTLKNIGQSAFFWDGALEEVISNILNPFEISDYVFMINYSSPSNATLHVPAGTMDAYKAITGWTMFQTIVEGVEKEATIDGLTYSYSTGSKQATVIAGNYEYLYHVDIPAKITINGVDYVVKAIGANAFSYCRNLYYISLPDGLETIGDYAFLCNGYLNDFKFPNQLKSIGKSAFSNCQRLKNIILPEGLETIGAWAFEYSGIQKFVLPSSLNSVGEGAFCNEESLKEVISHIQIPFDIDDNTFMNFDKLPLATLYVPIGTKFKYQAITGWTKFEGGIKEIGDVNGDGEITMTDVMNVISYLLGEAPESFVATAADMNGDGEVTVTDVLMMMELLVP